MSYIIISYENDIDRARLEESDCLPIEERELALDRMASLKHEYPWRTFALCKVEGELKHIIFEPTKEPAKRFLNQTTHD